MPLAGPVRGADADGRQVGLNYPQVPGAVSPLLRHAACKIQYRPLQVSSILDSDESYFNAAE